MPIDINPVIDRVIANEGGSKVTNDPDDGGGRTQYGISERANPEAWADEQVTEKEAKEIYLRKYVIWPGFNKLPVSHQRLQAQLIDYGVHSGPQLAIQKLQAILGVKIDGVLGPVTLRAIERTDPILLNNRLVHTRVKMIGQVVSRNPSQLKYLNGFLSRALDFLV